MKAIAASLLILTLLLSSLGGPRWPSWSKDLSKDLKCGMSLSEIQELSGLQITAASRPWGTHFINKGRSDLWLEIGEEGLESIMLVKTDGWKVMSTRSSPQENLCTGLLKFFLRIVWTTGLEGADVYLDGRKIESSDWKGAHLEVPQGDHELRIEKEGFVSIVRDLKFEPEDRGDQRITFTPEDLAPIEKHTTDGELKLP